MLLHLFVKNFALIDQVELDFYNGLNVLTGETGAGKSILIDALNLVLGERADRDLIQSGKDYAIVKALFDYNNNLIVISLLNELGIEEEADRTILFSRELFSNGRNICRINDRIVTLSTLKKISRYLVDVHGQHEHQSLLNIDFHIELLDSLGGDRISIPKKEFVKLYAEWKEIQEDIDKLSDNGMEGERRKDILSYIINEIEEASLKEGEEDNLVEERIIVNNAEKILSVLNNAYNKLNVGSENSPPVVDIINIITSEIRQIASMDTELNKILTELESLTYDLEEVTYNLRNYRDNFDYDPSKIDFIEERLDIIRGLKRKYGDTIEEISIFLEESKEELFLLNNSKELLDELKKREINIFKKMINKAKSLSKERKITATKFEKEIIIHLKDLGLDKAKFKVEFYENDGDIINKTNYDKVTSKGIDNVEFLIATNPGEPLKSLSKIVSGGEMSRIMLAFKTIMAQIDEIPTLIFDEIDTGISGQIAFITGEKMGEISRSRQVICVTHLPQIASMADNHYRIEKKLVDGNNRTFAYRLDYNERVKEIASMLGGENILDTSIEHSTELLKNANIKKKRL